MNTGSLLQIIIFILIFAGPTIGVIFRKLQEKRAHQQRRRIADETRREMLRTGQVTPGMARSSMVIDPQPTTAGARLQKAQPSTDASDAQMRQARLQELKRQQLERLRAAAAARAGQAGQPSVIAPAPSPGSPVGTSRLAPGRQTPIPPPSSFPSRTAPPQRQAPPRQQRPQTPQRPVLIPPQPQPARKPERASSPRPQVGTLGASTSGAAAGFAKAPPVEPLIDGRRITPQDWRRAIIMKEILDKPVALRSITDGEIG